MDLLKNLELNPVPTKELTTAEAIRVVASVGNYSLVSSERLPEGITQLKIAERLTACVRLMAGVETVEFAGAFLEDYICDQAYLQGVDVSRNSLSISMKGLACQMLASAFAGQFVGNGAKNYLVMNFSDNSDAELGDFTVTMQRKEGETPAEQLAEAKEEIARLKAELAALKSSSPAAAGTNKFGLDVSYFHKKLSQVMGDLGSYTPAELARVLARLCRTADAKVLAEVEFGGRSEFLEAELERMRALSVGNILLKVVPGPHGTGEEIYAQSVSEVEELIGKLGEQAENHELGVGCCSSRVVALEAEVARLKDAANKIDDAACMYLAHKEAFTDLAIVLMGDPSGRRTLDEAEQNYSKAADYLQEVLSEYENSKGSV